LTEKLSIQDASSVS